MGCREAVVAGRVASASFARGSCGVAYAVYSRVAELVIQMRRCLVVENERGICRESLEWCSSVLVFSGQVNWGSMLVVHSLRFWGFGSRPSWASGHGFNSYCLELGRHRDTSAHVPSLVDENPSTQTGFKHALPL